VSGRPGANGSCRTQNDGRRGASQHASGLAAAEIARRGRAMSAIQAQALLGREDIALIDLREGGEREKQGVIPGSLHSPYPNLKQNIGLGGMLHELGVGARKGLVFCCAFGECSALAGAGCARRRRHLGLSHRRRDARAPISATAVRRQTARERRQRARPS